MSKWKVSCSTFKEGVFYKTVTVKKCNTEALTIKQQNILQILKQSCTWTLSAIKQTPPPVCLCVQSFPLEQEASHKRVSRWRLQLEARMSCSHCVEPFSSVLSDSSSVPPAATADSSTLHTCLLTRAKPEMHRSRESVLRPRVRPRYTVLQGGQKRHEARRRRQGPNLFLSLVEINQYLLIHLISTYLQIKTNL